MTILELPRKGLDKYQGSREESEDRFAELFVRNVDALSHRKTLKIHIAIGGTVNF